MCVYNVLVHKMRITIWRLLNIHVKCEKRISYRLPGIHIHAPVSMYAMDAVALSILQFHIFLSILFFSFSFIVAACVCVCLLHFHQKREREPTKNATGNTKRY